MRVKNNHADFQPDDILSELKVAIYRKEAVKICCRELQERAVLYARPTHFDDGLNRVPRPFLTKALGNALVKQHAHALGRDRPLAVAPLLRFRGRHSESLPGIPQAAPQTPDSRAASKRNPRPGEDRVPPITSESLTIAEDWGMASN